MRKLLFCFLAFAATLSAFANTPPKKKQRFPLPPGTAKIANNFFADTKEISNMNYLEYLFWQERIYGKESEAYRNALPDTIVWLEDLTYNEPFIETYLRHPAYADYPVVGISYEQAQAYAAWRSDRVLEMRLLDAKKLDYKNFLQYQTAENCVTVERYLNGEIADLPFDADFPVAIYRLPSEEEWASLALAKKDESECPHGVNLKKVPAKMLDLKYMNVRNNNLAPYTGHLNDNANITAPVSSYLKNEFGLYNMVGNVAEMTATKGIAKGGSYLHTAEESLISAQQTYQTPTAWLGFRMVATYLEE